MTSIFLPAVRLMNHLRFAQKFLVMGALALGVMGLLLFQLLAGWLGELAQTRQQVAGLAVVAPATVVIRDLQQHRGLSNGVLNGARDLESRRAERAQAVDSAFVRLEALLPARLREDAHWTRARGRWEEIKADGLEQTATLNFQSHSEVIADLVVLLGDIADHYHLSLDAEPDTHYLIDTLLYKLPAALEGIAKLRGMGTGVLSRQAAADKQKIDLGTVLGATEVAIDSLSLNIEKASAFNPSLAPRLAPATSYASSRTASTPWRARLPP